MTSTLTPSRPDLGVPLHTVTYPIDVGYVQQWTVAAALAEAVSNAFDADPDRADIRYDDRTQELLVEDFADQGVGVESMVFGHSDKRGDDTQIGQFGEGLKIATIRAVSDPAVRHLVIESVGVTIVPGMADYAAIDGLAIPVKAARAPQVLVWHLHPGDRARGTLVRVGVAADLASEVISRFLRLTDPGYRPSALGTVLPNHPGRVYIGGVYVKTEPGLTYGYDLSLHDAKRFQNRDRTVVDAGALRAAITAVQSRITDPSVLVGLVDAALNGRLIDAERGFLQRLPSDVAGRRLWNDVAAVALGDPSRYYYREDSSDSSAGLALDDGNHEEITPNGLSRWEFNNLMRLLGIRKATVVRDQSARQRIEWSKRLTTAEASALDGAVSLLRRVYGADVLPARVRVYDRVDDGLGGQCSFDGLYVHGSDTVAVKRTTLADPSTLQEVLIHETAHRVGARRLLGTFERDFSDRSRGFENVLGKMASILLSHIPAGPGVEAFEVAEPAEAPIPPAPQRWGGLPAPSGRQFVFDKKHDQYAREEAVTAPEVRTLLTLALDKWSAAQTPPPQPRRLFTAFAKQHYLTSARLRHLFFEPVGSLVDYQQVADVANALGVHPGVVWWGTCGVMAMWQNRTPTTKTRKFTRVAADSARRACADLADTARYASYAPALAALAAGKATITPTWGGDQWLAPIHALVGAARDEAVASHGEAAWEAAFERAQGTGDVNYKQAWEKHVRASRAEAAA